MITLRLLGPVDVRIPDTAGRMPLVTAPKRLALVTFLAVARPRGHQRRDRVAALLWPEHDQAGARNALRFTVHRIRRELGDGVLTGRGTEELVLEPGALSCDVDAFENAIEAGRRRDALDLYRGDLLDGFYLPGAPEFELWLEEERRRLRRLAKTAAWAEADAALADGQTALAEWAARRAAALEPFDETGMRRLMSLLTRAGNPAGAVAVFDEYARRIETELGDAPSDETRALASLMRSRAAAMGLAAAAAVPPADPAPSDPAPAIASALITPASEPPEAESRDPAARPAQRSLDPRRRRLFAPGMLAAAAVIVIAITTGVGNRSTGDTMRAQSGRTVALNAFTYHGDARLAYLGDDMASILGAALDGGGDLRVIQSDLTAGVDRAASASRADVVLRGGIIEAGGKLQVTATLRARNGQVLARAEAAGPETSLFDLAGEVGRRLLAQYAPGADPRMTRLAALSTQSLPALKAYLEGEEARRAGDYGAAVEAFQRATHADSSFALAHYHLLIAADYAQRTELIAGALTRVQRHSSELPPPDRLRVEALAAYYRGDYVVAERLYRGIVTANPTDVTAWMQLGEVLFHGGPGSGRPFTDARGAFERVLSFDSLHDGAVLHLARIAARQERKTELVGLARRALRARPGGATGLELQGLLALTRGTPEAINRYAEVMRGTSDPTRALLPAWRVATYTANAAGVAFVARALAEDGSRQPEIRARWLLQLAHAEAGRGRWEAADSALAAVARFEPDAALLVRANLMTAPFAAVSRDRLQQLRNALLEWSRPEVPINLAAHGATADERSVYGQYLQLYFLALVENRLGEGQAALERVQSLERAASAPGTDAELTEALHSLVRLVRAQAPPGDALAGASINVLETTLPSRVLGWSPAFGPAPAAYLRALSFERRGRHAEVIAALHSIGQDQGYDLAWFGPAHLVRARAFERLGEPAQAAEEYRRFLTLWRDCDPPLRPMLAEARARLAKLPRS